MPTPPDDATRQAQCAADTVLLDQVLHHWASMDTVASEIYRAGRRGLERQEPTPLKPQQRAWLTKALARAKAARALDRG